MDDEKINKNNCSSAKGVYIKIKKSEQKCAKWVTYIYIRHQNKYIYVGTFDKLEDAKKARQDRTKQLSSAVYCEK